jgi:hypothetical protein
MAEFMDDLSKKSITFAAMKNWNKYQHLMNKRPFDSQGRHAGKNWNG